MNMKSVTHRLPILSALAFLALLGAPNAGARGDVPVPGAAPTDRPEGATDKLESYTYDRRDEFAAAVQEAAQKLDAQIEALPPAPAAGTPVRETRAKALEEVKSARRILDDRIGRVEFAIPDNWITVRTEVLTALGQVRSACDRATRS